MDSTDCNSSTPTSTTIGLAIGGIVILSIMICVLRLRRRRRLQQRPVQTTFVYTAPSNSYGRQQSIVYHSYPTQSQCPPGLQSPRPVPGQMNSLNRHGMTVAPSLPQPSHPSPMAHSARTRSPTTPSPTHYSYSNQTPHVSPPSSQNSTRLPPPGIPLSPSTHSRVSADTSTVQTPSISVTPAAYTPHATPVGRPSPPENMEMRPLAVNAGVQNDEPPPAYTPV
ncbi:hypothetical protein BDR03DRAFT_1016666 [Suillus americanus]|nr:hypothetical protein BDR03DRAFT_1016666 [Suillus americanus]